MSRSRDRPSVKPIWMVVAGVALTAVVVIPLVRLVVEAVAADAPLTEVWGSLAGPVRNSVVSSAVAATLALVIGLAGAILVERAGDGRSLQIAMILPLLIPPFVSAVGWQRAYGPTGALDDLLGIAMPGLEGGFGVAVVVAVNAAPIAYLVIRSALRSRIPLTLGAAARVSGAGVLREFVSVTMPLLRPALIGAYGLAFVFGVNAFGIPAVLGTPAGFSTVTTRIYQDLLRAADPAAFDRVLAAAALLVGIVVLVVGFTDAAGIRRIGEVTPTVRRTASRAPVGWLVWGYTAATTGVPLLALVLTAVTRAPGLAPVPSNWTAANFRTALSGAGARAFGTSLVLAAIAATVVMGLGGLSVVVARRRRGRSIGAATILTFAIPGSALAVAIALSYGRVFREGVVLILLAYLAKFWALGHRTLSGTAEGIASGPVLAARVSGADVRTAIRTVVFPLLRPAIGAGWIIVFLFGFHELTMSSLLYRPGAETLAVVVLNLQQLGDAGATAALAVVLTAVVLGGGAAGFFVMRGVR